MRINAETPTVRGGAVSIDRVERRARKVSEVLQQALADEQAQAGLREVAAMLTSLQAQLAEWLELHRLVHEVLIALAPFRALLASSGEGGLGAAERQALLQSWRPCQRRVDGLADFAEEIKCIGRRFQRDGRELDGEQWVVDIVALQVLLEDALKEDDPSPGSLFELAEELDGACHRHMTLADHNLKTIADGMQRLSTSLWGGLV
jgi:hypothetical protein